MIGFAIASWRWIELPFRGRQRRKSAVLTAGLASMALVALPAYVLAATQGMPSRAMAMTSLDEMWRWSCPAAIDLPRPFGTSRSFGAQWQSAAHRGILWGNSHAEHMAPLLDIAASRANVSLALVRRCSPFLSETVNSVLADSPNLYADCAQSHDEVIRLITSSPDIDTIVLSTTWSAAVPYLRSPTAPDATGLDLLRIGLASLLDQIADGKRRILLIGDLPRWKSDPLSCAVSDIVFLARRPCSEGERVIPYREYLAMNAAAYAALEEVSSRYPRVTFLPTASAMCSQAGCLSELHGEFLYRDVSHLRRNLSDTVKRDLVDLLGLDRVLAAL